MRFCPQCGRPAPEFIVPTVATGEPLDLRIEAALLAVSTTSRTGTSACGVAPAT
jgi:hypothetical protein